MIIKSIVSILCLCALAASAVTEPGKLELSVNESGSKLAEYQVDGKTFVKGIKGEPYSLTFHNGTAGRVLVIPSVDGLNVLNGVPARATDDGYIVDPGGTLEVRGWRKSLTEVREFVFDSKTNSYSAGVGQGTESCGVIACKVFSEKVAPQPTFQYWQNVVPNGFFTNGFVPYASTTNAADYGQLNMFTAASVNSTLATVPVSGSVLASSALVSAVQPEQKLEFTLGTGYGKPVVDNVHEIKFERADELATLTVYYADEAHLARVGIITKHAPLPVLPGSFTRWCPEPRWVADIK